MANKKFIQAAMKHPGALRKTAKAKGGLNKEGTIKKEFIDEAASGKFGKKTEKRADFAKTLEKIRRK